MGPPNQPVSFKDAGYVLVNPDLTQIHLTIIRQDATGGIYSDGYTYYMHRGSEIDLMPVHEQSAHDVNGNVQ